MLSLFLFTMTFLYDSFDIDYFISYKNTLIIRMANVKIKAEEYKPYFSLFQLNLYFKYKKRVFYKNLFNKKVLS